MRKLSRASVAAGSVLLVSLAAVALATPLAVSAETDSTSPTPPMSLPERGDKTGAEKVQKDAEKMKQQAEKLKLQAQERAAKLKAEAEKKKAERQGKLDAKKLDLCKKREERIGQLMVRINSRGEKQLELINAIATRVQSYKTDKNLTVANYDALLAEANTAKDEAGKAVDAVKASQTEFKCDGTDPKGAASVFQELMKAQNEALKAYKSAVIKLLVAVKQSQGDDKAGKKDDDSTTPATPPASPTPPADDSGNDTGDDNGGAQ